MRPAVAALAGAVLRTARLRHGVSEHELHDVDPDLAAWVVAGWESGRGELTLECMTRHLVAVGRARERKELSGGAAGDRG